LTSTPSKALDTKRFFRNVDMIGPDFGVVLSWTRSDEPIWRGGWGLALND
jgi:hypothetical protein